MRDQGEAALLAKIAESPEDSVGRLVLADYLDERDQPARAEFIRLQCELSDPAIDATVRTTLQQRERELLQSYRQEWIAEYGLPLSDVRFDRGLISAARINNWDSGRLLTPECLPWLATLQELDLSGLGLTNTDLQELAERAHFPDLRKLILSNNTISDTGAVALAFATGLPKLKTLYLFQNNVLQPGREALRASEQFSLTTLDLGERPDGYAQSKGQAEMARRVMIRERLLPVVMRLFASHPTLQSAVLCVAQYWADEANDAVHPMLIVSEHLTPIIQGIHDYDTWVRDPNIPNTKLKQQYSENTSVIELYNSGFGWDDNNRAIPLWSAYAPEGGSQEADDLDAYAPAVMFYRHGGYEFLPQQRPHLDGIQSEWGGEGAFD
jgi:uncharacterized protein (TIGR02996 family)